MDLGIPSFISGLQIYNSESSYGGFGSRSALPRPIRDIVYGLDYANETMKATNTPFAPTLSVEAIDFNKRLSKYVMGKVHGNAARVVLAVAGTIAYCGYGANIVPAAVVSGILSLPTLVVAGGGTALYHGVSQTLTSLRIADTVEAVKTLAIGLGLASGGWIALENFDKLPFGLVEEFFIKPLYESHSPAT